MPPTEIVMVDLEDDDKNIRRGLRFDKRAVFRLQEGGRSVSQLMNDVMRGNSNAVVRFVWAGLLHEQPRLTIDRAIELTPLPATDELMIGILRALVPVFGDSSELPELLERLENAKAEAEGEETGSGKKKPAKGSKKSETDS